MIPKVFHQVWLGDEVLPDNFIKWREKLLYLNKDWSILIWNDKNIKKLKYYKDDLFQRLQNYSEKSDYIRYLCVYEFWGVYLDTDIEPIKPFEEIIQKISEKWIFIWSEWTTDGKTILNGALFGAKRKDKILRKLIQKIETRIAWKTRWIASHEKIGPFFITKILMQHKEDLTVFDPSFFHPKPWWEKKNKIYENTITLHHYYHSWRESIFIKWRNKIWRKIKYIRTAN